MCTAICKYGLYPYPLVSTCKNGVLDQGCYTAEDRTKKVLETQVFMDDGFPAERYVAPLRSWWYNNVDVKHMYDPVRSQETNMPMNYFKAFVIEFEMRVTCNYYQQNAEEPHTLATPNHVELIKDFTHAVQHALQLPNATQSIQVISCEFNKTKLLLIPASQQGVGDQSVYTTPPSRPDGGDVDLYATKETP